MRKMKLQKPKKHSRSSYDYHECQDYLQAKYGYNERDYSKKFHDGKYDETRPSRDFWHWLLDQGYPIHNGTYIWFQRENWEELNENNPEEAWVKTIYGYYLDEFADRDGSLEMWVEW